MNERILKNILSKSRLAERLSRLSQVTRFNRGGEKEEWNITSSFEKIEESLYDFNLHLGMLANQQDITPQEMESLLFEIGEDFRSIIYYIQSMAYYDYLWDIE